MLKIAAAAVAFEFQQLSSATFHATLSSGTSRTFREWNPDQSWLFLPAPQDWLTDGHLVYFLLDVSERLDLSSIVERYDSQKGRTLASGIAGR